jgi:hypothetical protein
MKKTIEFVLIIFAGLAFSSVAFADWAVTVTWEKGGPNLLEEDCVKAGVVMKTIAAADPAVCNFVVTEAEGLTNQVIQIVSRNIQGTEAGFDAGVLFPAPNPGKNSHISTSWFNPNK